MKVGIVFDSLSLVTSSYSVHYAWLGFCDYLLQAKMLGITGHTQKCLFSINKKEDLNITCHPVTNLWVIINDLIEKQATNIDVFAERRINDIVLGS